MKKIGYKKMFGDFKARAASQAGFTLVELMVVVAIIGVLATLAVPQYQRFTAKARQSEAKIALGAMRSAIESYRPENGMTGCLRQTGYSPPVGRAYYAAGVVNGTVPGAAGQCGPNPVGGTARNCNQFTDWANAGAEGNQCVAGDWQFAANIGEGGGVAAAVGDLPAAATGIISPDAYLFGVAGRIRNASGAIDQWTIDQNGNTSNTVSGI